MRVIGVSDVAGWGLLLRMVSECVRCGFYVVGRYG